VERDDDRDGARSLTVCVPVVVVGVLDPVVTVRMNLRQTPHLFGPQMLARRPHRVSRHGVVPGPKNRLGDYNGRGHEHLIPRQDARVSRLVDAESVEIRNALDTRVVLGEQREHGVPDALRNADLDSHTASTCFDEPRYPEPLRAL
jgi:hypothetical protein